MLTSMYIFNSIKIINVRVSGIIRSARNAQPQNSKSPEFTKITLSKRVSYIEYTSIIKFLYITDFLCGNTIVKISIEIVPNVRL